MSSKDLPRTMSSYNSNPSSLVINGLERETLDLDFFSLTTSETATTAGERLGRRRRRREVEDEGLERESLRVDPRKEEGVVLRG